MKEKKKHIYQLIIILLLGFAALGIKLLLNHNEPPIIYQGNVSMQNSENDGETSGLVNELDQTAVINQVIEISASEEQRFPVFISGAVYTPGIYNITASSYLYEALHEAGDMTEQAAKEYIHLVYQIEQPLSVYIPTYEEINQYLTGDENAILLLKNGMFQGILQMGNYANQGKPGTDALKENTNKNPENKNTAVNINQADLKLLLTLPGVGSSTAEAIITYRETNGPFSRIEDIMNVPGIKEGKFAAIQEMITV